MPVRLWPIPPPGRIGAGFGGRPGERGIAPGTSERRAHPARRHGLARRSHRPVETILPMMGSTVVSRTSPASSIDLVRTVAISCLPNALRTISSPLKSEAPPNSNHVGTLEAATTVGMRLAKRERARLDRANPGHLKLSVDLYDLFDRFLTGTAYSLGPPTSKETGPWPAIRNSPKRSQRRLIPPHNARQSRLSTTIDGG
jgi:hypothetical protein